MLDVRLPALLREVALQGSFSPAAQALTYSQSAVSQQIATLEREAGTRLVERNGRSVRLTDAGRALVRRADASLTELEGAERDLQLIAGLRGGRVRVSTFASAATALLPEAVTAFRAAHPGVRVELSLVEDTAEAVEGLRAGRTDLALLAEPLADPGPVETHQLLDDPLLACHAAGFEPLVSVEFPTDDYHATQGMVAAGAGITLLPRLALSVPRDDLMVRPLAGQGLHRQVVAATRRDDQAPATLAMLKEIRGTGRRLSGS